MKDLKEKKEKARQLLETLTFENLQAMPLYLINDYLGVLDIEEFQEIYNKKEKLHKALEESKKKE